MSQLDRDDPRTRHPRPPFPAQTQSGTGSVRDMDPVPDHGETSYVGTGRLVGRRVLVTGADSGIGRAAAIACAREGASVALTSLPEEASDLDDVRRIIEAGLPDGDAPGNAAPGGDAPGSAAPGSPAPGARVAVLPADLSIEANCEQLVADAVRALGGLDGLVVVAGTQKVHEDITDHPTEDFDHTFKVNVYALFWLCRAAVPHLAPGSSIVTTSSVSAYVPQARMIDYAATKAAIITWTNGLAKQLAPKGVRANTVVPGPVWTPLQPTSYAGDEIAHYAEDAPLGRPAQPVELASAYVHLLGAESSYTSGTTLTVGGATSVAL